MGGFRRALIVSLGGSIAPVVEMINDFVDDETFVVFLASDTGNRETSTKYWVEGKIPEKHRKIFDGENLIEICGGRLKEGNYQIIGIDPDKLEQAYESLERVYLALKRDGVKEILANFSGGTKIMSSSIVLLSIIYPDVDLFFNASYRTNVEKETNTRVVRIETKGIMERLLRSNVNRLYQNYQYDSAVIEIDNFMSRYRSNDRELFIARDVARAFALWDKFEFQKSYEILSKVGDERWSEHIKVLESLKDRGPINYGYKFIELINNAKRRAHNQEYDNAVARLYRSLEVLAQALLYKFYNLKTKEVSHNLDLLRNNGLNGEDVEYYAKKTRGIGLMESYELLTKLKDTRDNVGTVYLKFKKELEGVIAHRNDSILAHGFRPIGKDNFSKFLSVVESFYEEVINMLPEKRKIQIRGVELPTTYFL